MQFKVASRSATEIAAHKAELDAIVKNAVGHDKRGRIDPKGLRELDNNRIEIAQLVVQLIEDSVALTDPTPFMVDRRTYGLDDQILFQEARANGLTVTKRAYGTKPLAQRTTKLEYSMNTTASEIAIVLPLEEIASGASSASDAVAAMSEAINRWNLQMVLDAIDAGVPAATADRTGKAGYTLRYSGLTKDNLAKCIDGMRDDGDVPTVFGRHTALFPAIRAFEDWSEASKRDFEVRGQVGIYLGANLVTMADRYSRFFGSHAIRADRVYVAAGNKGAIMAERDLSFLNYAVTDARTGTFETGMRMESGVLVYNPYAYRVIEL